MDEISTSSLLLFEADNLTITIDCEYYIFYAIGYRDQDSRFNACIDSVSYNHRYVVSQQCWQLQTWFEHKLFWA